uniref:Uncharacterized protein n=1 Tax=Anguilla anguilla TaxID=7936 RepID=A0A0E9QW48_ANGAN
MRAKQGKVVAPAIAGSRYIGDRNTCVYSDLGEQTNIQRAKYKSHITSRTITKQITTEWQGRCIKGAAESNKL